MGGEGLTRRELRELQARAAQQPASDADDPESEEIPHSDAAPAVDGEALDPAEELFALPADDDEPSEKPAKAPRPRRRATVASVLGELLVTAGLVVMLYVAWQLMIGDMITSARLNAAGAALSQQWAQTPPESTNPPPQKDPEKNVWQPVAMQPVPRAQVFGVMHIPRLGDDFAVEVSNGILGWESINKGIIGHYPDTQMPGSPGNFAVAAHRSGGWGAPFADLPSLRIGDAVVLETADGWYTYRFRNIEYVRPSQGEVLLPVPQQSGMTATDQFITMTSCSPRWGADERVIAYGLLESFTPRAEGAPDSLRGV